MKIPFMNEINSTFEYNRIFQYLTIQKYIPIVVLTIWFWTHDWKWLKSHQHRVLESRSFPFPQERMCYGMLHFFYTDLFMDVCVDFTIPCSRSLVNAVQGFHYLVHLIFLSWNNVSFKLGNVHFISKRFIQKSSCHIKVKHFPSLMCRKCHNTMDCAHLTTITKDLCKSTPFFAQTREQLNKCYTYRLSHQW